MITRRNGETVRLAEPDLVAGKVVPAAPAKRRGLPAATVRELQETAARAWPALETERLGAWLLRASAGEPRGARPAGAASGRREGFTAGANSVLPLGSPELPLPEALERVERWYDERGLPPLVQVTTGAPEDAEPGGTRPPGAVVGGQAGEGLAAELEQRGWTAERHTVLRVGALAPLADREPDARVELSREPDAGWLAMYGRTGEPADTELKVVTGGPSVWFATVRGGEGGNPEAIGRCVVDGRWAGFDAVEVAPECRREEPAARSASYGGGGRATGGLVTAVMGELARRALEEGASAAYLQVETGNREARALYDGLGFADHHAYHYRRAPRE